MAALVWLSCVSPVAAQSPAEDTPGLDGTGGTVDGPLVGGPGRLVWKAHYLPVHWSEAVVTGAFAGSFLLVEMLMYTPLEPRWEGGVLFDDAVRSWLVASDPETRGTADVLSDVFWYTGEAWPLVDAVFAAGVAHRRWDVSWQLTAMWFESTAIIGFFSRLTQRGFARERPLARECDADPEYSELCFTRSANTAFISGHTAGPMVSAGHTCAVHQFLDLYGSNLAGALACAGNITLGLLAGGFRLVTDRHWVTDVLAGAALGFAVGYFVPWLHFKLREPDEPTSARQARGMPRTEGGEGTGAGPGAAEPAGVLVAPWVDADGFGVGVIGFW
jgi:hypothetical protein